MQYCFSNKLYFKKENLGQHYSFLSYFWHSFLCSVWFVLCSLGAPLYFSAISRLVFSCGGFWAVISLAGWNETWYYNHKCFVEGLPRNETPPLAATSLVQMEMINAVLTQQTEKRKRGRREGNYGTAWSFGEKGWSLFFCVKLPSHEQLFRNFAPYKEFCSLIWLRLLSSLVNSSLHKFTHSLRDQCQRRNKHTSC